MRTINRRVRAVSALAVSLSLVAAACGGDDDDATADTEPPADTTAGSTTPADGTTDTTDASTPPGAGADDDAAATADRDASFSFGYSTGHTSFDPHRTPAGGDQLYIRMVYDSLLRIGRNDSGTVAAVPNLATGYEFSDDALALTLTLRDDVAFQDGEPFNADAVVANMERALDDESTVSSYLTSVVDVVAVDEYTVEFQLDGPDAGLPWALASNTTGYMVSPAAFDTDLSTTPVGTGPFTLVSAQRDAEVVYERWDGHWNPDAALVDEFRLVTMPDQNARYNGVQSGELDAAFLANPLDAESRSLESEGFHWVHTVSPVTFGLAMNADLAPFDDPRVRQAADIMINRTELSEQLLNGINPPVYQPISEGFFGHNPDLDVDRYDPELAAQLIEEAGVAGTEITLIQVTTPPQESLALVVQQALGDLGFTVTLDPYSSTEARTVWRDGNHQGIVMPIIAQLEPSQTYGISYLGVDNPADPPAELVELTDAAAALLPGSPEQEAAYQEVEAWLVENPIHANYVNFSTVILARPDVVGSDRMITTGITEFDMRGVGKTSS